MHARLEGQDTWQRYRHSSNNLIYDHRLDLQHPWACMDQTLTDRMIVKRALTTNSDDEFGDKSELKEGNCIS
jgi:hypothetical protein